MEFKKLSAVEMVAAVDQDTTVLIEKDGVIKRAPKDEINVQADWSETDSSSLAFIKNKPVEEYDIDVVANITKITDDRMEWEYDIRHVSSYNDILAKLEAGIEPKGRVIFNNLSCSNERTDGYYVYPMMAAGYNCGWEYWQDYGEIIWYACSIDMFSIDVIFTEDGSIHFDARFD